MLAGGSGGLDGRGAWVGFSRFCACTACFAMKQGPNPSLRPPPSADRSSSCDRRSSCACQKPASRSSIRSSASKGSGCQTSTAGLSHCSSSSSELEQSDPKDGCLALSSPLSSHDVAAAFAFGSMSLILVNIGSVSSPSRGAAATSFERCCWQRSIRLSVIGQEHGGEAGQPEE